MTRFKYQQGGTIDRRRGLYDSLKKRGAITNLSYEGFRNMRPSEINLLMETTRKRRQIGGETGVSEPGDDYMNNDPEIELDSEGKPFNYKRAGQITGKAAGLATGIVGSAIQDDTKGASSGQNMLGSTLSGAGEGFATAGPLGAVAGAASSIIANRQQAAQQQEQVAEGQKAENVGSLGTSLNPLVAADGMRTNGNNYRHSNNYDSNLTKMNSMKQNGMGHPQTWWNPEHKTYLKGMMRNYGGRSMYQDGGGTGMGRVSRRMAREKAEKMAMMQAEAERAQMMQDDSDLTRGFEASPNPQEYRESLMTPEQRQRMMDMRMDAPNRFNNRGIDKRGRDLNNMPQSSRYAMGGMTNQYMRGNDPYGRDYDRMQMGGMTRPYSSGMMDDGMGMMPSYRMGGRATNRNRMYEMGGRYGKKY